MSIYRRANIVLIHHSIIPCPASDITPWVNDGYSLTNPPKPTLISALNSQLTTLNFFSSSHVTRHMSLLGDCLDVTPIPVVRTETD
jgi:hypothetical protein